MICSLRDEAARDVLVVGGKAAALAGLIASNFPVPEGFVVTAEREPDLDARLVEIAKGFGPNRLFAVRSSGYLEDSARTSFAGQYETVLGVSGRDVSEAIAHCFRSFSMAGAVIVQQLIEADAAGIAFTANPVNGERDCVLIEANFGFGESVVGGEVSPDGFTVIKKTGQIVQRRIADKEVWSVLAANRSRLQAMPENMRLQPCLSDDHVRAIAGLAIGVEELYTVPVDIEWACEDGKIWLLQARPVTGVHF
jgi:pyruvate,water dikinase